MTIKELYQKYHIMPQLKIHMLRVAGVGKIILSGSKISVDMDLVMKSLLLHDMGNIVKFDLANPLMKVPDLEYWKKIQMDYFDKYGKDTHKVTTQIIGEIGQDEVNKVMEEEHHGYESGDTMKILKKSWPAKILAYCDVRVDPWGVVPMSKRIKDLHNRYGRDLAWYDFLYKLEADVKSMTTTDLDSITEESVKPFFDELLTYTI